MKQLGRVKSNNTSVDEISESSDKAWEQKPLDHQII